MEIIFKGPHEGKTTDAVEFALQLMEGNVLFVTTESRKSDIAKLVLDMSELHQDLDGMLYIVEADNAATVDAYIQNFVDDTREDFSAIVLDVNYAVSRQEWFNLAMKLEKEGYIVVGTQTIIKTGKAKAKAKPAVFDIDKFLWDSEQSRKELSNMYLNNKNIH